MNTFRYSVEGLTIAITFFAFTAVEFVVLLFFN